MQPRESSHFEFYELGQDKLVVPLSNSSLYTEDWLGLRQLDAGGRLCCDWSVRATIFRCLQAGSRPISFRCWRDPLRRSLILLEFSIASCNETRAATARAGAEHWMRLINCFGGDDPNKLPW